MTGTTTPNRGTGAMQATATGASSGAAVNVNVNGVTTLVQCARDLTIASGDVVLIQRVGSVWVVVARLYPSAPAAPSNGTAPDPHPSTTTGTLTISPVTTQTYRGGKWRTDTNNVIQGDWSGTGNNTGGVFYGDKPRSLAGATVTAARMQVRRVDGGFNAGFNTSMRLVTESTRPAGAPTLTSSATGPNLAVGATNAGFVVPTAWAQAMVDGTAGGIGFLSTADQAHYCKFAGLGDWSAAFTMSIDWSR